MTKCREKTTLGMVIEIKDRGEINASEYTNEFSNELIRLIKEQENMRREAKVEE